MANSQPLQATSSQYLDPEDMIMSLQIILESPEGLSGQGPLASAQQRPFDSHSPLAQTAALRRQAYIDAFNAQCSPCYTKYKLEAFIQDIALRIGDNKPPSSSTLYRWHTRLQNSGGNPLALVPSFDRCGGKGPRMEGELLLLTEAVIQTT
ncbi:hypothetical protein C3L29_034390, partial [Pseudomonas sp. MWU12-2534b]